MARERPMTSLPHQTSPKKEVDVFVSADEKLVEAAKSIKVLSQLGWSEDHAEVFLAGWRRKQPKLPKVEYPKFSYTDQIAALRKIIATTSEDHPVGWYIQKTAHSYVMAAQMLEGVGTSAFRECSERIYGRPDEHIGRLSNLDIADDFIAITDDFRAILEHETPAAQISSFDAAAIVKQRSDEFFGDYSIRVVTDKTLGSKAAAGSERVRLREHATFSAAEIEQLLQHEVYVHSATMLNGRRQPYLKSMGLGAPRTTATQEGLATFAELISGTMDLSRLRRIALRTKGIQHGLDGADFIEVFKFFLEAGQSEIESFQSAARVFRGGDTRGKHVFTKDVVYLKGLLSVHAFLRKAILERKIDYPQLLFSGRLTVGDVFRMEDAFKDGWLVPGQYLPPWASNRQGLAAYLCYNAFSSRLRLEEVRLVDFTSDIIDPAELD
jgi:uncharacterized protein (TIGR02421 family)